jgi:hypothetical protein
MNCIPAGMVEVLLLLRETFKDYHIKWVLVGSTCLALQGIDLPAHDIDIITNANDAQACNEILEENLRVPVAWGETANYASFFGQFSINSIQVEIMGDLQVWQCGEWVPLVSYLVKPILIKLVGQLIPVSSLKDQLVGYANSERKKDRDVADLIRNALQKKKS